MLRFVQPETVRIMLEGGAWLLVKKRLSAGEYRTMLRRMSDRAPDGSYRIDPLETGIARMLAYLVDWSLPDYVIRDKSTSELETALNMLEPDDFEIVMHAIIAHEAAMLAERTEEKKLRSGGKPLSLILPSPGDAVGGTSG